MSSNPVLRVTDLEKCYHIYEQPRDRLIQGIMPKLQRLARRPPKQYYREFWALRGVSFEIKKGETIGIIGQNGSGKSTLLQMICGTLSPTGGSIELHGRVAALLELGAGFNPDFTGRENVYMNATILGLTKNEIDNRFDEIAAFADIGEFIEQPVKTYSSGMYVRLAFAVIAHVDAEILIVDEALAVGDALFQFKCMAKIKRLLDNGTTLLFVSHDVAAVKSLCSSVLWLDKGIPLAFGSTPDVTRRYAESWVTEANRIQGAESPSLLHNRPGNGDVRISTVWSTAAGVTLEQESLLEYGDELTVHVQIEVRKPCSSLIISYHLKDRQNQHLLGSHTADNDLVYRRLWKAGERFEVVFTVPVIVKDGNYSLTVLIASIGDIKRYSDAVFMDWFEDVQVFRVAPRPLFPLSDLVQPGQQAVVRQLPDLQEKDKGRICILDDFFPNLLTGFRIAEYNEYLEQIPELLILSDYPAFHEAHAAYRRQYPQFADRILPLQEELLKNCRFVYMNFLNNAVKFLPLLEKTGIPFMFTLYPGGGFGLNEQESDVKLQRVCSSPLLKKIITTQNITAAYLHERFPDLATQHLYGVAVNPLYFEKPLQERSYYQAGKATFDVCFVAEKYMASGANKGYPEFAAMMKLVASQAPEARFHVVGSFSAEDGDIDGLEERLTFYGSLTTRQLKDFFIQMDLIVSPNQPYLLSPGNFDGFPTGCCTEASLCGVAVICTDILRLNEYYRHGQDILLTSAEPDEISSLALDLYHQPDRLQTLARNGQQSSIRLFSPQAQLKSRLEIVSGTCRETVTGAGNV